MNSLVVQIYQSSRDKYLKFKSRLDKHIASGKFNKLTQYQRHKLLSRLKRLQNRVLQLHAQLKLAVASGALALVLNASPAEAQTSIGPFERNYLDNPLPPPIRNMPNPSPAFADLDGDGDQDMVVGTLNNIIAFENIGTEQEPFFLERHNTESVISLDIVDSQIPNDRTNLSPTFADIDDDGDLDLLVGTDYYGKYGNNSGDLYFFRNTGSATVPQFALNTGTASPFRDINDIPFSSERHAQPTLADFDGDGDIDLLLGGYYNYSTYGFILQYFENTGTKSNPLYVKNTTHSILNAVNNIYAQPTTRVSLADLDEDGDLDVFLSLDTEVIYVRNNSGVFTSVNSDPTQTGTWVPNVANPGNSQGNPFHEITIEPHWKIVSFADIDLDDDLDVIIGITYEYGNTPDIPRVLTYYENLGQGVLQLRQGLDSPVDGVNMGGNAISSFIDYDQDNDLDIVTSGNTILTDCEDGCASELSNQISFLENVNGIFVDNGLPSIFANLQLQGGGDGSGKVVDVNGDGQLDFIVPYYTVNNFGTITAASVQYFENVNGILVGQTGTENPFAGFNDATEIIAFDFADLNKDGKTDLIYCVNDNKPKLYENTGTAAQPVYTPNEMWSSVFNQNHVANSNPKFIDIDNDGDYDIVVGKYRFIWLFENTGSPTSPQFVAIDQASSKNPFSLAAIGNLPESSPNFLDVDGDGDMDLISGNKYGTFSYYENTNPAPVAQIAATLEVEGNNPTPLNASVTVTDADNDLLSQVIVEIVDYQAGKEVLGFTSQNGITGVFNATDGKLTLQGLSTVANYSTAIMSITYQYTGANPEGGKKSLNSKTLAVNRTISFLVLDQDRTTPIPTQISVAITFNAVVNAAPQIATINQATQLGSIVMIELNPFLSDPDNNLDLNSLRILSAPTSGAPASIYGTTLSIDYSSLNFAGTDQLTIEVCDFMGLCVQGSISIEVEGDIVVYNGVSANGDAQNSFFNISNIQIIEPTNRVSIYNRWGSLVFEIDNYDNNTRRFDGINKNGNPLPGGVYFYKIEFFSGRPSLSGYLTLKR